MALNKVVTSTSLKGTAAKIVGGSNATPSIWNTTLKDLQPLKLIRRTDGGTLVYSVTRVNFGGIYRLKMVPKDERVAGDVLREVELLTLLRDKKCIGFLHCYDWTEDNRYYYLLTNYYAKATPLEKTIKTFRDSFTSEEEKRRKRGVGGGFEDFCVRLIITLSERITTLHELGFCVDGLNMDAVSVDVDGKFLLTRYEKIKMYKYTKLYQNFGDKFVMTEEDKNKCNCYKRLGSLLQTAVSLHGSKTDDLDF
ncbi:uncharacterized protein LOC142337212 isoform X2 [Convolutriloba macropyga]|uniref:uncharacterized protein LOC142337212 isoform X2 n=1 Tax=Convolutriloba macropyga TaxID=536237 RepID=UPI003F5235EF